MKFLSIKHFLSLKSDIFLYASFRRFGRFVSCAEKGVGSRKNKVFDINTTSIGGWRFIVKQLRCPTLFLRQATGNTFAYAMKQPQSRLIDDNIVEDLYGR